MQDAVWILLVVRFRHPDGIGTREQRGPGRPADGLRVKAGEPYALRRHLVEHRRPDVCCSVYANVVIALVVGEDHDEIRLPTCAFFG